MFNGYTTAIDAIQHDIIERILVMQRLTDRITNAIKLCIENKDTYKPEGSPILSLLVAKDKLDESLISCHKVLRSINGLKGGYDE